MDTHQDSIDDEESMKMKDRNTDDDFYNFRPSVFISISFFPFYQGNGENDWTMQAV